MFETQLYIQVVFRLIGKKSYMYKMRARLGADCKVNRNSQWGVNLKSGTAICAYLPNSSSYPHFGKTLLIKMFKNNNKTLSLDWYLKGI